MPRSLLNMEALVVLVGWVIHCSAQEIQNINILYVNENGNSIADEGVLGAAAYVEGNTNLALSVDITKVVTNRTDSVELLQPLCQVFADMMKSSKLPSLVLDTTMTGLSSETVKSFTAALGLPTITASFGQEKDLIKWRNLDENEKKYMIQINPPNDIIPEIIRDIVVRQNITNAAILFDSSFVMEHKYKSLLQNIATRNVITAIDDAKLTEQIRKLKQMDLVNFFILGRIDTINKVLNLASGFNFMTRKFAWHFITSDMGDISCSCKEMERALFVKPSIDASSQERFDSIRKTYNLKSLPEITSAFYFDLALRSFLTARSMLVNGTWTRNMTEYITCDDFDGTNTPKATDFDLRSAFMKESAAEPIYGPFNISSNGNSFINFNMDINIATFQNNGVERSVKMGVWSAGLGGSLTFPNSNLMDNFTSALIYRAVVVEQKPFIFRDPKHAKGYNGYCIDMMDMIAEILGFEYEVQLATGNKMGDLDEQGKWDGMIKDLVDKKADIGLGSISVMAERESVIDFTVPYYDLVGYSILMKTSNIPPSLYKFLSVLEDDVWISILVAYFLTSFLLWAFDKYSPNSFQNNPEKYANEEDNRIFSMKESLWFCMTSLTPQGGGEAPKNLSGRLVAATWWLFGFIIIASYTANLAAFLTVSRLEHTIESLEDLSKQYRVSYAPVNGSATMTYFERMANIETKFYEVWKEMSLNDSLSNLERSKLAVWDYPVSDKYTKIWQAMQDTGLPHSQEEAVEKVKASKSATSGFAFIADATDVKYQELITCDLVAIGDEFSRKPYALAVQQGSPLVESLNIVILELINRRKLEVLRKKWWENNPERMKCPDPEDPSEGISMRNIGGVFILIIIGIGFACVILTIEYYLYKREKETKVISVRDKQSRTEMPTGSPGIESLRRIGLKDGPNFAAAAKKNFPGN